MTDEGTVPVRIDSEGTLHGPVEIPAHVWREAKALRLMTGCDQGDGRPTFDVVTAATLAAAWARACGTGTDADRVAGAAWVEGLIGAALNPPDPRR
ncbi:MAG: hypothetical protein OXH49_11355 [Gemmatimonadetes bacterium]|nr:hypothetical protein [Gemmatimonadota bacterium]